jgi:hypothetical protein
MLSVLIERNELQRAMQAAVRTTVNMSRMIDLSDPYNAGVMIGRMQALEEMAIAAGINLSAGDIARLLEGQQVQKLLKGEHP